MKAILVMAVLVAAMVSEAHAQGYYYRYYRPQCTTCAPSYAPAKAEHHHHTAEHKHSTTTSNIDRSTNFEIKQQFVFAQDATDQGGTIFGYPGFVPSYGALNIGETLNLAGRLAQNAQQLAGQATSDYNDMTATSIKAITDLAKIDMTSRAAQAALREAANLGAGDGGGTTFRRTFAFSATVGPDGTMTVAPQSSAADSQDAPEDSGAALLESVNTRCIECHKGDTASKGIDLSKILDFTEAQMRQVVAAIDNADPAKRMPPKQPAIPLEEKLLYHLQWDTVRRGAK